MALTVVGLIRSILAGVVSEGDRVVDATVGNGRDTVFLAGLVGDRGKVYGFDIQQLAIDLTKERLKAQRLEQRAELICGGHESMDRYITEKVKAVVFNLGYLPGGSHRITTLSDTTLVAVKKSVKMLLPGGITVIAVYCGHKEGEKEEILLKDYFSTLDASTYITISVQAANQKNSPPGLLAVQRKK
jgi:predicted methyltransferase